MRVQQAGFTLIELVMVIVILGILSATAVPKFFDMQSDAKTAAVEGMAGALGSASSINYAARTINPAQGVEIDNCTDVALALDGGLDSDYQILNVAINKTTEEEKTCTVRRTAETSFSATWTGRGID